MPMTIVIDAANVAEVLAEKLSDEGFNEATIERAAETILGDLDGPCLYSLTEFLIEQAGLEDKALEIAGYIKSGAW